MKRERRAWNGGGQPYVSASGAEPGVIRLTVQIDRAGTPHHQRPIRVPLRIHEAEKLRRELASLLATYGGRGC